jgi:hypothetical protein
MAETRMRINNAHKLISRKNIIDQKRISNLKSQLEENKSNYQQIIYQINFIMNEEILKKISICKKNSEINKTYREFIALSKQLNEELNKSLQYEKQRRQIDVEKQLREWFSVIRAKTRLLELKELQNINLKLQKDIQTKCVLETIIKEHTLQLISMQEQLFVATSALNTINSQIVNVQQISDELHIIQSNKDHLSRDSELYREYIRLFSATNIPLKLTQDYINILNSKANEIFGKYTKYVFKAYLTTDLVKSKDQVGLHFCVVEKTTDLEQALGNLSGFETALLTIAINYSIARLNGKIQCGMLLVDEVLDKFDEERWTEILPEIMHIMRENYQKILTISQRCFADEMIDNQIKIHQTDDLKWSSID